MIFSEKINKLKYIETLMDELRKKFIKNGRIINGTWKNKDNHKFFTKCLGKELGYIHQEDWYGITKKNTRKSWRIFT